MSHKFFYKKWDRRSLFSESISKSSTMAAVPTAYLEDWHWVQECDSLSTAFTLDNHQEVDGLLLALHQLPKSRYFFEPGASRKEALIIDSSSASDTDDNVTEHTFNSESVYQGKGVQGVPHSFAANFTSLGAVQPAIDVQSAPETFLCKRSLARRVNNNVIIHNMVKDLLASETITIMSSLPGFEDEKGSAIGASICMHIPGGTKVLFSALDRYLCLETCSKAKKRGKVNAMKQHLKRAMLTPMWYMHDTVNYNYSDRPNEWDTEYWKLVYNKHWNKATQYNFMEKMSSFIQ